MADTIVITDTTFSIITSATQGPAGISGASATIVYIAGVDIGSNRGIVLDNLTAIYADNTITSQAGKFIGISINAVTQGSNVIIQTSGEIDGFSGLTPNSKIYLQANGVLTSTIPTSGFIQQVGIALSTTKLLINIQPSLVIIG